MSKLKVQRNSKIRNTLVLTKGSFLCHSRKNGGLFPEGTRPRFLPEFIPINFGAGMTALFEAIV